MKLWTNRDWFWLTAILTAIILFIFSFRLSDNQDVVEIFSFLANGVSIALAFVAIFVSLGQNRESQEISREMNKTLNQVEIKIQSVNDKVVDISSVINSRILGILKGVNEFDEINPKDPEDLGLKTYLEEELLKLKEELNVKMNSSFVTDNNSEMGVDYDSLLVRRINKVTKDMGMFGYTDLLSKLVSTYNQDFDMLKIDAALKLLINDREILKVNNKFVNKDSLRVQINKINTSE